ncbi:MAG: MFS transporter [Chloroflexi bacterium]|nr:MFS transporter [Chloroflexota bacterium]
MTMPATAPRSMFAVFRKRDFSLMWSAQLVSTIGSSLTDLAAGILVYRVTESALNVGLTLMVTAIPTLFVGLFAGVFVDRFDRKRILLGSDLLRGLIVLAIPFSVENFGLISLYVLLFLAAIVRQFFDPAWESVLPEIASDEELAAANSFLSISSFGSTAVGFALAGFLASVDIQLPFYIDALTFLLSFLIVLGVRISKMGHEDSTTVGVVIDNLKTGVRFLWRTPLLRSSLIVNLPVLFSFGLWNVLLLPMAISELGASEFEYGLQEGLTSVGFVASALLMAKYADRLREGQWMVVATIGMGIFGVAYGFATNIWFAIAMVVGSGFLNSPLGIARRLILQKNTPREMRGRVFSAFSVSRDVVFLAGMALAGLADVLPIRGLVITSAIILIGAGVLTQFMPGLGTPAAEWRRAAQLLRTATAAPLAAAGRAATAMDFDRLLDLVPELGGLDVSRRTDFLVGAMVRTADPGSAIVKVGDAGDSAFFVLGGRAVAGIPSEDGSTRSLSAMGAGDFFGEIAALTGSPRTANVVADEPTEFIEVPAATLKGLMDVPAMNSLITSKLQERLTRTSNADMVRLAGLDQRDLKDLRRRRPNAQERPATNPEAGGQGPG